jgi:uncharacterized protein (DUF4415 family)
MEITCNATKDALNRQKHGVPFGLASQINWLEVLSRPETRRDYGEVREIGYALISDRLYCVVFTPRADTMHIISLRKANAREVRMFKDRKIIMPTPEEDVEINKGIAADPDTYELSEEEIKRLKPFKEVMEERRRIGRPPKENPKEQVSIRYDADILAAFKATGDGWQTRMNAALREYLEEHPLKRQAGN